MAQTLLAETTLDFSDPKMPSPEDFEKDIMALVTGFLFSTNGEIGEKIVVQIYLEDLKPQRTTINMN